MAVLRARQLQFRSPSVSGVACIGSKRRRRQPYSTRPIRNTANRQTADRNRRIEPKLSRLPPPAPLDDCGCELANPTMRRISVLRQSFLVLGHRLNSARRIGAHRQSHSAGAGRSPSTDALSCFSFGVRNVDTFRLPNTARKLKTSLHRIKPSLVNNNSARRFMRTRT